ncbi:hypothetical protein vseg_017394 [Gypsophila vaccaria]
MSRPPPPPPQHSSTPQQTRPRYQAQPYTTSEASPTLPQGNPTTPHTGYPYPPPEFPHLGGGYGYPSFNRYPPPSVSLPFSGYPPPPGRYGNPPIGGYIPYPTVRNPRHQQPPENLDFWNWLLISEFSSLFDY